MMLYAVCKICNRYKINVNMEILNVIILFCIIILVCCIFGQINAALVSMRRLLSEFFFSIIQTIPTPKCLNGIFTIFQLNLLEIHNGLYFTRH